MPTISTAFKIVSSGKTERRTLLAGVAANDATSAVSIESRLGLTQQTPVIPFTKFILAVASSECKATLILNGGAPQVIRVNGLLAYSGGSGSIQFLNDIGNPTTVDNTLSVRVVHD